MSIITCPHAFLFMYFSSQEAKKKYDKETEKYCAVLEKHLSLSAKKKESHLHEVNFFFLFLHIIICLITQLCHLSFWCRSPAGGQPGRSRAAAFLWGFFGVCLQSARGPREEDVWLCGARKITFGIFFSWPRWIPSSPDISLGTLDHAWNAFAPSAVGFPPRPLHLLSPRLRAGKGLQPLQDGPYNQHTKCKVTCACFSWITILIFLCLDRK